MRLITGKQCLVLQNNVFRKSHNLVGKREIKNEISIMQTVYEKSVKEISIRLRLAKIFLRRSEQLSDHFLINFNLT